MVLLRALGMRASPAATPRRCAISIRIAADCASRPVLPTASSTCSARLEVGVPPPQVPHLSHILIRDHAPQQRVYSLVYAAGAEAGGDLDQLVADRTCLVDLAVLEVPDRLEMQRERSRPSELDPSALRAHRLLRRGYGLRSHAQVAVAKPLVVEQMPQLIGTNPGGLI